MTLEHILQDECFCPDGTLVKVFWKYKGRGERLEEVGGFLDDNIVAFHNCWVSHLTYDETKKKIEVWTYDQPAKWWLDRRAKDGKTGSKT